jgi:putative lipoprotein
MKNKLAFIIVIIVFMACAHKTIPTNAVADLSGTWQILTVNGINVMKSDAGKVMPSLEFNTANNTVSGTTGCNRFNGKAAITKSSISFGPLATTMMACQNALYERPIFQALIGNLSYTYENGIVSISKEGKVLMTLGR